MSMLATIKKYAQITKPGIVCGNMIAAAGGFLLAAGGHADIAALLPVVTGISLVVASGCVFNNWLDRDLDHKMARTRNRVLARGHMSSRAAVCYGGLLGLAGLLLLWTTAPRLCLAIVLAGFAIYVGLYSLYLKRYSLHATLIGSLAGAAPPLAGYCAANSRFDLGAFLILAIYCLWQIPHSYAIAVFRFDDYRAAAIPVLPVIRGIAAARKQITWYITAFTVAALMLTLSGYTGYIYLAVVAGLGLAWLFVAWWRKDGADDRLWAKRLFVFSILCMIALNIMIAIDAAVPPAAPLKKLAAMEYSLSNISPDFK
jgi:protoheme IX farnesyltransferase